VVARERGIRHRAELGSVARMVNGYVRIRTTRGWEYEHRVVMERLLRRPLRRDESVHHINEDRTDNRIANLRLMNNREHDRMETRKRWSDGTFVRQAPICGVIRTERHVRGQPCRLRCWGRCPHHG